MAGRNHEQEKRLLIRAGCVPLVTLSFVLIGIDRVRHWIDLTDSLGFALLTFAICIGAGVPYLVKIPNRPLPRLALITAYIPLMTVALWWYGFFFSMLVLGVLP